MVNPRLYIIKWILFLSLQGFLYDESFYLSKSPHFPLWVGILFIKCTRERETGMILLHLQLPFSVVSPEINLPPSTDYIWLLIKNK